MSHQRCSAVVWGSGGLLPVNINSSIQTPAAKTAFSVSLSLSLFLHDTRAVIAEPSAQWRTHVSAARFNGRKLETKNRAAAIGHLAPSASTQTMEDLSVFSLQLPPAAPR